jgi:hypothetical protein
MTKMVDIEGAHLPEKDDFNCWDIDIWWYEKTGPELLLSIPDRFLVVPDEPRDVPYWGEDESLEYDGEGCLSVSLRDVFEEYLENFRFQDEGEFVTEFAAWLRSYADRLEAKKRDGPLPHPTARELWERIPEGPPKRRGP